MKTTKNTILISGGSAGIGFEMAKILLRKGNEVIITGRNSDRLQRAVAQLPGVTGIVSDITKDEDAEKLVNTLEAEFPKLNMIINNAGQAFVNTLQNENAFEKAGEEMLTNYLSVIRINEKLLPLLSSQDEAAIVNVTSIAAFVPNYTISTYSASKAALHSYSQSLRNVLASTGNVKVFELMPPLVNTDFSQEIGGSNGISPVVVAEDLIDALENDIYEIHVGLTAGMYELSRSAPADALLAMNSN